MDPSILVTFLVVALGAVFMYFVGAVVIQSLRLSIIQVKSDVQIKMDRHQQEIEQQRLQLESKRLSLTGSTDGPDNPPKENKEITTLELEIDGEKSGLKEALEQLDWVKKFVIFKKSILMDLEGEKTASDVIEEIEKATNIHVTQVNFAKNTTNKES